jgi:hypothetical protein
LGRPLYWALTILLGAGICIGAICPSGLPPRHEPCFRSYFSIAWWSSPTWCWREDLFFGSRCNSRRCGPARNGSAERCLRRQRFVFSVAALCAVPRVRLLALLRRAFVTARLIFGELGVAWVVCLVTALLSWVVGSFCVADDTRTLIRSVARAPRCAPGASPSPYPRRSSWSSPCCSGAASSSMAPRNCTCFSRSATLRPRRTGFKSSAAACLVHPSSIEDLDSWVEACEQSARNQAEPSRLKKISSVRHTELERLFLRPAQTSGGCCVPGIDYLTGLLLISVTPGMPYHPRPNGRLLFFCWSARRRPRCLFEIFPEWAVKSMTTRKTMPRGRIGGPADWTTRRS